MSDARVALITGASSGFGHLTAGLLASRGWRVFGTSRKPDAGNAAMGVEMLPLDVRSDDSVRQCAAAVLEKAGGRLDLLVNNAGYVHNAPLEETTLEEAQALFETNFFGAVRMTDAVLPAMRGRRCGSIINVGSLAGRMGVPGEGFYSATKFALEGYSEALSYELAPFHISVVLVEPGFFRTNLARTVTPAAHEIRDYDAFRAVISAIFMQGIRRGGDPQKVARLIVRIAEMKAPRLRYRVGADSTWLPRLRAVLPERLYAWGVRKKFGLR
jgi:NAD(P)-dependent dehydrogenase (short-subunit alcohol dehydrogenase family)